MSDVFHKVTKEMFPWRKVYPVDALGFFFFSFPLSNNDIRILIAEFPKKVKAGMHDGVCTQYQFDYYFKLLKFLSLNSTQCNY